MQTYKQLQQSLGFDKDLPVTVDWSAAADFLFLIKDYCQAESPQTIVECSSGLTTLTLARCCQLNKSGHVYSLENGEEYQLQTKKHLQQFQLENYADVFYAPLRQTTVNGINYDWYTADAIADLKIDMLIIDGPPGFIQKHSRLPALPVLFEQLADKACIFLDDAARDEEKEIVAMWLEQFTGLSHEYIETDRGCSVIKVRKV
jgi:predicted O-methyltransferase YrrM